MTYLISPISGHTPDDVLSHARTALDAGAEAIELRLDLCGPYTVDDLRALRKAVPSNVPLILTIRTIFEGGAWDDGDDVAISKLIELGPMVDYIDVELSWWQGSANIRQKIGLALRRAGHFSQDGGREEIDEAAPRKLILSRHDHTGRPPTLSSDLYLMCDEPACNVSKLAWRARTVRDNFESFELMRSSPKPIIAICMGPHGVASRVLAKKFGAFGTFSAPAAGLETAAGQLTLAEMRALYRWDSINRETAVYGLIGSPIAHSLSPAVHNAGFEAAGVNAVYLPFDVSPGYESFKAFMVEALARPWLDLRGLSITIPHKQNALRFLQEKGGALDDIAARVGAINTFRIEPDGRLDGLNTDYAAALDGICQVLHCEPRQLRGKRAAILGAGGVARAVVAALTDHGADVTIFNRTTDKAAALAAEFGGRHQPWDRRGVIDADLLINCTSVGLWPAVGESPMPEGVRNTKAAVFDTVYRPLQTRLLMEARQEGCRTMDGLSMFVHQAHAQFQYWTGRSVPAEGYRKAAIARVEGDV
ncbi:MAG TPA: shikimate dehydrogenase [Phycisphaerae bacterium]|nr:shikimate dehydrogenase [Phycisphaerae bacterium]